MADPQHLALIKQGVADWNRWGKQNPTTRAALSEAQLSEAQLSGVDLYGANLSGADLSGADLTLAILSGANLTATNLIDASVGGTHFADLDLRTVKGLETLNHLGPSHVSITALYRSEGQILDSFLRKAGVPEDFLLYLPSLVNRAIEYYTCFISYSSQDQEFVERLYTDLQSKGVRCWFAPHDLRPGTYIRQGIDDAIRLYDKLILILSQNAITSGWVQYEAEIAMHKERERRSLVLFPLRIDEAIMTCQEGWAHSLRARHIGDFRHWKDHDSYQQELKHLLRDLQPSKPSQDTKP
jgi:hypothetical protein